MYSNLVALGGSRRQRCSRGFELGWHCQKTQVGGSPRAPKKRSTPQENSSWEVSNANFFSLRDKTQVGGFKPARAPARIAQSLAQAPSSRHPICTRSPRAVRPQRKCTRHRVVPILYPAALLQKQLKSAMKPPETVVETATGSQKLKLKPLSCQRSQTHVLRLTRPRLHLFERACR